MGMDAEFYVVRENAWTEDDIDRLDYALAQIEQDLGLERHAAPLKSEPVTRFLNRMRLVYPGFGYTDASGGSTALPVLALILALQDLKMGEILYGPDCDIPSEVDSKLLAALSKLAMRDRQRLNDGSEE